MKEEGQSPDGFMFVNYDARTKGQGPEAPLRSIKRAHVTRQHYRKVRRQRMEAWSNTDGESGIESSRGGPSTLVVLNKKPKAQEATRPARNFHLSKTAKHGTEDDFHYQQITGSPNSMLGQGRGDPFKLFPAENVPVLVEQLLDHAVETLTDPLTKGLNHYWVELAALSPKGDLQPVLADWMLATRSSPVVFYAFLYAISNHYDFVRGTHESSSSTALMRLSYKTQTIKLVNELLSNLDKEVPDDLLSAVLVLASQGPRVGAFEKSPFESPLATAQCLDHQGNLTFEPEHARGMVALVRLKGGLQNMGMRGMGEIIAYADIIAATLSLCKPQFPLIQPPVSLVASGKHKLDQTAMELAQHLGSGFRELYPLCLIDDVWKVVEAMCEVTVAVDHYHRGGPFAPEMPDIVVARNSTQHRLLSLPEYPLQPPSHSNYMYEICRVAALTYSNIVIFPLPPASGLHTNLVFRLKQLLTHVMPSCPDAHLHVILWAITLGAISTGSSSERVWFLYKFAEISTKLGLYQWSRIHRCLTSLLWLDFVMEKEGVQLWLGARDLIHQNQKVVYPEPR